MNGKLLAAAKKKNAETHSGKGFRHEILLQKILLTLLSSAEISERGIDAFERFFLAAGIDRQEAGVADAACHGEL